MALKEVAIAIGTVGRTAVEGDVIVIREPTGFIGRKEACQYLWVLIDDSELPMGTLNGKEEDGTFRLNIPFSRITSMMPNIDLRRVRDPQDHYQPFLDTERETGRSMAARVLTLGRSLVDRKSR